MAKIALTATIKPRFWFWSMVSIGQFAIDLGACPDKICSWIAKYGVSVKLDGR